MTILETIAAAAERLTAAGLSQGDAVFDAEVLARHALGWDRATYLVNRVTPAEDRFNQVYQPLITRRAAREPVHLILGEREFWGRSFELSRDVLSPRPETELVIETALEVESGSPSRLRIVDAGTGSGCLAVTLALEIPRATVVATDISPFALGIARRNAARHGVSARVLFVRGDFLSGLRGSFDLIVSNPPYVASGARDLLPPEVREYEPDVALFGGADGLDAIRVLLGHASARLRPSGWLIMEFGAGQHDDLHRIVRSSPLRLTEVRQDLQGIPRVAIIRK